MQNQVFTLNRLNSPLLILLWLFMLSRVGAAELVFNPATPIVEIGQQLTLSVSGTSGEITWNPTKGQIQGAGNQVTYIAPAQAGADVVTVLDSAGNAGLVKITVTPKQLVSLENTNRVSLENANWEVFINRDRITANLLSDDGKTLWVGTEGGLEQRDASTGELVRVFTNLDGLPSNWITALESDGSGGLWIGTLASHGGGRLTHRSASGEWTVYNQDNSELPGFINALESDGSGGLWIGTWGGLAYRSVSGEWTVYNQENSGLPYNRIDVLESDSGGLWIGSRQHGNEIKGGLVYRSVSGEWTVYTTDNLGLLPDDRIEALESDGRGGLWIGTNGGGLVYRSVSGEWTVYSELLYNYITTLESDGNGGLWIGISGNGLFYRSVSGEWTNFSELSGQSVQALLRDDNGGLWIWTGEIGTDMSSGIAYRSVSGEWTVYTTDKSELPSNFVDALENDGSGGLWIGTVLGLAHRSVSDEWMNHILNSELPDMFVYDPLQDVRVLLRDASGGLWVGTYGGLAYRSISGEWTVYTTDNSGLPDNNIGFLESDGGGGLWIGTLEYVTTEKGVVEGVLAYRNVNGEWTVYTTDNSGLLNNNDISALKSDGRGGLWIGILHWKNRDTIVGNGLAYLSVNGEWTIYTTDNSELPDNNVRVLESDGSGGLWIGTWGGLAYRSVSGEWTVYTTDNSGLPDNFISSLESDDSGGLWIGTNGGLAYRSVSGEWTVYTTDNSGLPDNDVRTLESDGSGGLWIGVINEGGLTHLTFGQKTSLAQTIQDEAIRTELLTGERAAILIHPRGQGTGYNQDISIEFMATHAYRTLHNRGYDNDEIYFLSYKPDVDINGDGMVDRNVVDGPITQFDLVAGTPSRDLTRADVQQAFDWAKQKGKLDQPLLVIFIDHALTGKLRLDPFNEVLTAQDLNVMLTEYQLATGSQAIVVLEACHTGSLVSGLAGPNRLIVTSTAEDKAYYDNLGMFSFSKFFFDNLRRGESFFNAFQTVKDKLPTYGHPFNLQIPQLDDDGDGVNSSNDGRLARKLCLNGCFGALSGEITLEPETPAATVTAGQTIELVVRAGITEGRIKRVWALIMTPDAAKQRNEQGFSLIATPVVNLNQKPEDTSRWQSSFSGFNYRGDYVITFMAEDNEGFITAAPPVVLTQTEGPEAPDIETDNSAAPLIAQTEYHDGDLFKVTLPPLPTEQAQYVGIALPDGTIFVLGDLNGFVPFDGVTLPVWQGGEVAIEVPISSGIPRGEYAIYLLRVPVGIEPMANQAQWQLGVSGFKIE
jgi:ligand-binding sensor domain-containing protein